MVKIPKSLAEILANFGSADGIELFIQNNSSYSSFFKYKEKMDTSTRREGLLELGVRNYGKGTMGMYMRVEDENHKTVLRVDDIISMYFTDMNNGFTIENREMTVSYYYNDENREEVE